MVAEGKTTETNNIITQVDKTLHRWKLNKPKHFL
jgi:hypothetical protein